jgi:hypothetical protein
MKPRCGPREMRKEHTNQESQLVNVGQDNNRPSLKENYSRKNGGRFFQVYQSEQKSQLVIAPFIRRISSKLPDQFVISRCLFSC